MHIHYLFVMHTLNNNTIVERLALMWKPSSTELLELTIPTDCAVFRDKFNSLQESIAKISVMDELLAGM